MKLDYLSFTIVGAGENIRNAAELFYVAMGLVRQHAGPEWWSFIEDGQAFIPATGRAPYRWSARRMDGGVSIFGSEKREEILIEMTGRACDPLDTLAKAGDFIRPLVENVTRIDLAVDYETDVQPDEFVAAGYSSRFKSSASQKSGSGHTEYIGSMRSDLMARVYRYKAPHPRAHLLRVEHVFRRARAKSCAEWLVNALNDYDAEAQLLATFDWKHDLADCVIDGTPTIPTKRVERSAQGRVWWLYKQVVPALGQALYDGSIEWEDFRAAVATEWERLNEVEMANE